MRRESPLHISVSLPDPCGRVTTIIHVGLTRAAGFDPIAANPCSVMALPHDLKPSAYWTALRKAVALRGSDWFHDVTIGD
jgi:hypothetical protein